MNSFARTTKMITFKRPRQPERDQEYLKAIYWPAVVKKDAQCYVDVEWHEYHDHHHEGRIYDEKIETLLDMNIPAMVEYVNGDYTRDLYLGAVAFKDWWVKRTDEDKIELQTGQWFIVLLLTMVHCQRAACWCFCFCFYHHMPFECQSAFVWIY